MTDNPTGPIWLTEADVVSLVHLGDAVDALESGLAMEAAGEAENMIKTHLIFAGHDTLHAIGASVKGAGLVGTKTWAHTTGGAAPLLVLFDSADGSCQAVIEAFALGQMRTGAISGVATRWLSAEGADEMAIIGTGKQAITQVAAVAAVRRLKRLRVHSPTEAHREAFAERVRKDFDFTVEVAASVEAAAKDAPIVTAVTLSLEPFLSAAMVAPGTHINAIGAIVPERIEFTQDILPRCAMVAVDTVSSVQNLSQEFRQYYDDGPGSWDDVTPISAVIASGRPRPPDADLTLFKAMGMGLSDLALAQEVLARARKRGVGQVLPQRERAIPRLAAEPVHGE